MEETSSLFNNISDAYSMTSNCTNSTFDHEGQLNCGGSDGLDDQYDLYEPSVGIVILLSLCYGLISAGAVFGNCLVIYMVVRNRRMRTITNFFIANLALSDVVIGMFSIPFQFQAALLQRWNLPAVMCSLCPFFQNVSVNTSIFTLIAIAMDRYNAIIYPFRKKSSKRGTKIRIAFIWVCSVLLAVPQVIAFRVEFVDHNVPQCIPNNISFEAFKWYMFGLCFVQYFVPLCLLCFAYARIALNLWGRKAPGEAEERRDANILRNKKKAIKVLMFVVVLFGFCWLPLQTYCVTSVIFEGVNSFKYINIVWFVSHWLAMSNSCVNPFIYFFCHDKFKKEFQDHFKWCFRKISQGRNSRAPSIMISEVPQLPSPLLLLTPTTVAEVAAVTTDKMPLLDMLLLQQQRISDYAHDLPVMERSRRNGRHSTFRGGRNVYLTHSVSSEEDRGEVTRQEMTVFSTASTKL